ncbi:MAG: DNA repair protein RecN [Pseudomonadota bacterium]
MLNSLSIKDFAIIDEIEVSFESGFNVMTGETGAGKTIIVEALRLVLGARASTDIIRAGRDRASVTAIFDSSSLPQAIKKALDESGIECGDEIIIHRVVGAQGKGRISINGVAISVSVLKSVAEHLVDISSQHESQMLLDETRHANMLDSFAGLESMYETYVDARKIWSEAARELNALEADEKNAKERIDFLRFQQSELDRADVKPCEDEMIDEERARLKHAVLLKERTSAAESILSGGEASAACAINSVLQMLSQCAPYEPKTKAWIESLERAHIELDEVTRELAQYSENIGSDPVRLEELEDRLHLIKTLVRKHGGSVDALIKRRQDIAFEVSKVENYDSLLEEKRNGACALAEKMRAAARELSKSRRLAAKDMSVRVVSELLELGMAKIQFSVVVEQKDEAEWDESGPDRVEFLISPNAGEPMSPLAKIASGGELSRIMLALKGALAKGDSIPDTSVFDEVDSGIGGAVASVVGKKLKSLAECRQVICITHLPQVAAFAKQHLRIEKRVKQGRTIASLADLNEKDRVAEIARMLGSDHVTPVTIAHAEEMLAMAHRNS